MWVPPEVQDPVVLHAPTRKSVALFGAVNIRTGKLVTMLIPTFDAEAFEAFLKLLLRHRKRSGKTVVVLDNASYHKRSALPAHLQASPQRVSLDYLPPYSPDLNPIERVWKLLRYLCLHNQYFPDLELLVDAVCSQLKTWAQPNSTLLKLCAIT